MLKSYKQKRDFSRTGEPAPTATGQSGGILRFVVQKHAARRLHYDLRLEFDGVLKSWPVPKGPSLDPQEKRLAVMVEDHPLDYASYEGVIAHGNYGAGEMIVWDAGAYSPDEGGRLSFGNRDEADQRMRQGLEAGKLSFVLRGRKLKGSWTLVRTARSPKEWLLIKHRDEYADAERDILEEDRSIQSGLTIADLKDGRMPDPALASGKGLGNIGTPAPFPKKLRPMLARLIAEPFSHPDWLFEPKLDGFRALAFLRDGDVTLLSRNGTDLTGYYPAVVEELAAQPEAEMVLDGEVVALDEGGLPNFGLLQRSVDLGKHGRAIHIETPENIVYYPFDLLYLNGSSLHKVPLSERKALLTRTVVPGSAIQPVEYVSGEGDQFFHAAVQLGLEGMVAKNRDSIYEPGARTRAWLKVKGEEAQEFVVGGYTKGAGAREATFGALVLGYYDGPELRYAGRVGSGFDKTSLDSLAAELRGLDTDENLFAPDAELDKTDAQWVEARLVARVKFANWTGDGRLRAPVFLGLERGIEPKTVRRESADATLRPAPVEAEGPTSAGLDDISSILDQLSGSSNDVMLDLGEHRIRLSNLNKVFWPETPDRGPLTKREMIRYYARMAPFLLPHLMDRPLTLTRYPDGIYGESFYQKRWEHELPDFAETVELFSSRNEGNVEYLVVNNVPTVIWLAQLADLELHPWLSRTVQWPDASQLTTTFTGSSEKIRGSVLNYPDFIVFDLDPYIYSGQEQKGDEPELNRQAFAKAVEVARALKDILDQLSLSSFLKTSGKTGLHIYVPILRQYDYKVTRKTCELVGRFLLQQLPRDVTMEWAVDKRAGKIFLDHNQNVMGKNMASIYSLRPLAGAPVSTPLRWDELGSVYPTDFDIETVPERVARVGDLWADILGAKHDLRRLLESER